MVTKVNGIALVNAFTVQDCTHGALTVFPIWGDEVNDDGSWSAVAVDAHDIFYRITLYRVPDWDESADNAYDGDVQFDAVESDHVLEPIDPEDAHYIENIVYSTEAEVLATKIRASGTWDLDQIEKLCGLADMADEWENADGETFEGVAYAAAEKLGVEI